MATRKRLSASAKIGGILALVALSGGLLSQPAVATPPTTAGGTFVLTGAVTTGVRVADGNTFISQTISETISGTYNGAVTGDVVATLHSNGETALRGILACTCVVVGQGVGTLVLRFDGQGPTGRTINGVYRVVAGTGALSGAHGQGTFSLLGATGTYSGRQHYEP